MTREVDREAEVLGRPYPLRSPLWTLMDDVGRRVVEDAWWWDQRWIEAAQRERVARERGRMGEPL